MKKKNTATKAQRIARTCNFAHFQLSGIYGILLSMLKELDKKEFDFSPRVVNLRLEIGTLLHCVGVTNRRLKIRG